MIKLMLCFVLCLFTPSNSYSFDLNDGNNGFIVNFDEAHVTCNVPQQAVVNSVTIDIRGIVRDSIKGENLSTTQAQTLNHWRQYGFFVGTIDWTTYTLNNELKYNATIWDGNTDYAGTSGDTNTDNLIFNDSITITAQENPTFVNSFVGSGTKTIIFGCKKWYESDFIPDLDVSWNQINGCKGTVTFTLN